MSMPDLVPVRRALLSGKGQHRIGALGPVCCEQPSDGENKIAFALDVEEGP